MVEMAERPSNGHIYKMLVDNVERPLARNIEDAVSSFRHAHIPGPNLRRLLNAQDLQPLHAEQRAQS